ncbi:hypothetical protein Glove_277g42 [Diversispora epigaea]|uniref:PEP5/VPS11 N-terminal domain-containing protein n=1 Tax=Diversispora epigaea TaxID=1348612 RepID=A0A397I9P0_9GLOM|nr:hypothetical protein Glove_277g42 [Diversispora epigaea]
MSARHHSRTLSERSLPVKQWRQFNFFDVQQIKDQRDATKPPEIFQKTDITVSTSGRGNIILADILLNIV